MKAAGALEATATSTGAGASGSPVASEVSVCEAASGAAVAASALDSTGAVSSLLFVVAEAIETTGVEFASFAAIFADIETVEAIWGCSKSAARASNIFFSSVRC
jgi:hypothetical protein